MNTIHLTLLDWVVTIFYLVAIAAIGVMAGRRVKDTDSYFLGKRSFNKWLMIGQAFGTGTHAEMPVSLAGAVYTIGVSGIWYQWKNLFATPFYWLFAPMFRRMRRTTTGEIFEDRYGPWLGAIYTVFALGFFTINTASMLKGAGKVISQATGGDVPVNEIVIGMTVVFILYSFIGGLMAAAWTDFVQGGLIIVLSFLLIPLGWSGVGGLSGMRQVLEPSRFSLATPSGIGPWFIFMLTLNGLIGIMAQPHILAATGTGKDEYACRTGFMYGTYLKRFCTIGWVMVGLMVSAMAARGVPLHDPEDAFGYACRQLLFPGGVGLLVASVLAANMAACSAFMVNSGALFTRNFYRRYLVRNAADSHYLLVGRLSGLGVTMLGVLYSIFLIKRVLYSFLLTETMATYVGISLLGGIIWKRANRWGAIASLAVSMAVNFGMYRLRGERLDHWDPAVFGASLAAGVAALVIVSLLTRPEPAEAVEAFAENLQTPITPGPGSRLLIPDLLHLQRPFLANYRIDLTGLATGSLPPLVTVAALWLLLQL